MAGLLGSGGMGEVFRGVHIELGRDVAIKRLKPGLSVDQSVLKRFINEARAVNVIRHENIVEVTDFFTDDEGRVHMVMELLEGRSLGALISARAPLPPARVAHIGVQIAEALQAAHEHGVIHRDLKPENIFLIQRKSTDDYVKLLDFGIARLHPDCGGIEATESGLIIGTPVYMPPEQAKGGHVTWAADAYSLGVILYEMLSGQWPFKRASAVQMMMAHIADPPPPLDVPGLPDGFKRLVESLLAKEPEDRPASMREIATRLEAWAEHTRLTESDVLPERGMSDTQMPQLLGASQQTWDLAGRTLTPPDLPQADKRPSTRLVAIMGVAVVVAGAASYLLIKGRSHRETEQVAQAPLPPTISMRAKIDEAIGAFGFPPTPSACKTQDEAVLKVQLRSLFLLRSGGPGSRRPEDSEAETSLRSLGSEMSPETSLWKARAQLQLGNAEAAIKHAQLAADSCPALAAAFATEGTALALLGKHQEARAKYEQALRLAPEYLDARFNLAVSEVTLDDWRAAIDSLSLVIDENPQLPGAHALRGQAYLQVGEVESAKLDLEIAVRIADDSAPAWFALGYARKATGDTEGASEAYCRAHDLGHTRAPCSVGGNTEWPEGWQDDPVRP